MNKTIFVGLAVFAIGCSDGLTDEESSQAFSATQVVLAQGSAAANTSTAGPADTLNVNHAFNCFEGGSATFSGNVETADNGNSAFTYSVDFNSCVSQGVTMSGNMDYELSFEKTGEQSFKSVFSFSGDLSYSGEVEGECEMEMVATSSVDQSGASFTYVGNLCGNDAKTTLNSTVDFDDLDIPTF